MKEVPRWCPLCRHAWKEPANLAVLERNRCPNCKGRRLKRPGPSTVYPKIRRDPAKIALAERRLVEQMGAWGRS